MRILFPSLQTFLSSYQKKVYFLFVVIEKTLTFGVEIVPQRGNEWNLMFHLNEKSYVRKKKNIWKKEQKFALNVEL